MTLEARSIKSGVTASGAIRVPPSKSHTNRALNLALLGSGQVALDRPLVSEDTEAFLAALRAIGREVRLEAGRVSIGQGQARAAAAIDCGASGTMLRFLTASLATIPGTWILDGTERLRSRPLSSLLNALRALGARVECLGREGFAPIQIEGGSFVGGETRLDASESSQFLSSLLMASTRAHRQVTIEAEKLVSKPYVDLTLQSMAAFGLEVECSEDRYSVAPQEIEDVRVEIEGDYSSACYFAAAAALTAGSVTLEGLRSDSRQGDAGFLDVLERMGASRAWREGLLTVEGPSTLRSVDEIFSDMPDQVPTLAALAPFAPGRTHIRGVGHLRHKESDRLEVVAAELGRAGLDGVELTETALSIPGHWSEGPVPTDGVLIDSADDHRIAMSFALVGLRRPGLSIAEPAVVAKSYPDFWRAFSSVCQ